MRVAAVPFAALEVGVFTPRYPAGYEAWAWAVTALLALGAGVLFVAARRLPGRRAALAALAFDTSIIVAYLFVYSFEADAQVKQLLYVPVIEAAFMFGLRGGLAMPFVIAPLLAAAELFRHERFDFAFSGDHVTFPLGLQLVVGAIVGRLTNRLETATHQLARRVDALEAVNR